MLVEKESEMFEDDYVRGAQGEYRFLPVKDIISPTSMSLECPDGAMRGIVPKLEQAFVPSDPSSGDNGSEQSQVDQIGESAENRPEVLLVEETDHAIERCNEVKLPEQLHGEVNGHGIEDLDADIGMEGALKYFVFEDMGPL